MVGQMKAHMETHSGVHPFVCVECGAAFTKANSLKKHSMLHLGIKPFACDSCEMRLLRFIMFIIKTLHLFIIAVV